MTPQGKHFGLIGHPIGHSQSPKLFREAHPGSPDVYDLIQTPEFEKAYETFLKDYDAVNVTAPFKEDAFRKADVKDSACAIIGATNLLVKEEGVVKAYNTDMDGVMKCLWKGIGVQINSGIWNRMPVKDMDALVIGCGGAGKAAAIACLNLGFKTHIVNRTRPRAYELVDRISSFRRAVPEVVDYFNIEKAIASCQIIVYTIPEPIGPMLKADLSGKIILEANYRERSVQESSITKTTLYLEGKEWLFEQALASWKRMPISSY